MAVIRCPNCGKPNPDFIEACQYCDARLYPEGIAPATPQPSATPSSVDDTLIRNPAASAQSSEAEAEPLDWMGRLRRVQSGGAQPAAQAQSDEPDWMWTGKPAGEPETAATQPAGAPAPAEDSSLELPEWLRDLDEPTDVAAAAPAAPAAPVAPVASAPPASPITNYQLPITATQPPAPSVPPEPSPFEPTASDQTIPPRSRRKLTDWLDKVKDIPASAPGSAEPEQQATPNSDADLPDWLKAVAAEAEGPGNAAPAIEAATKSLDAPAAMPTPEDELPDWLNALRTQSKSPARVPGTGALQSRPPAGTSSLSAAGRVQELPASVRSQAPDDTLVPRPGAKPLEPASDDMPDWLRGILSTHAQDAAPAAADVAAQSPAAPEAQIPAKLPAAGEAAIAPKATPAPQTAAPDTAAPPLAASTDAALTTEAEAESVAPATEVPSATTPPSQPTSITNYPLPITPQSGDDTLPPPSRRGKRMTDWLGSVPAPAASGAPAEEELPDWLKALSTDSIASAATEPERPADQAWAPRPPDAPADAASPITPSPATPPHEEDLPDWLKALAPDTTPQPEPAGAVPEPEPASSITNYRAERPITPSPALPKEEDLPDWLKAITQSQTTEPAPTPPAATTPVVPEHEPESSITNYDAERPTTPAPIVPTQEEDLPDWLKAITQASATAATAAVSDATTTFVPGMAAEPAAAEPITPRGGPLSVTADQEPAATPPEAAAAEPITHYPLPITTDQAPSASAPLPPWLQGAGSGPLPELPELDEETLAWLNDAQKVEAAPEPASPELAAAQIPPEKPAWLDELAAVSVAATPELASTPDKDLPDWLRAMRGQTAEEQMAPEGMPDWLRALRGLPPGAVAPPGTTPAPLAGKPAAAGATPEAAAALASTTPAAMAPVAGAKPYSAPSGLEQAALPAWLAAMRPVDIEQPTATEADSYEETLGVLAGMRGVLRAEPVVAQPHKATTPIHNLAASPTQATNANLLTELLRAETAVQPVRRGRVRLSTLAERWAVFAVLLIALLLAQFQAQLQLPSLFAPPSPNLPPEAAAVYTTIEGLPKDKPALIAFDYDVVQQGELDPGAQAVVGHLSRHGLAVVAVSLRLTGPAVAQQVLSATAKTGYLNLGFIPGGPVGLLQFAADPRSTFHSDFAGNNAIWSAPIFSNIHTLADFGLIVLVSGAPESARAWMEQAQSFAGNVPTVAVVSAGAEPMVWPYYDDPNAKSPLAGQLPIKGLIVGLGGAAAYERATYSPGPAMALWPALGGGLLAAALIIALGNLSFVAWGALRRRRA